NRGEEIAAIHLAEHVGLRCFPASTKYPLETGRLVCSVLSEAVRVEERRPGRGTGPPNAEHAYDPLSVHNTARHLVAGFSRRPPRGRGRRLLSPEWNRRRSSGGGI